jgi:hypothetical protein
VIEAHYSVCNAVGSALGNFIAEFVLRYYGEFMQGAVSRPWLLSIRLLL